MKGGEEFEYPGRELALFATAMHWKAYWGSRIRRWVKGDVLEVGAGLGANISSLMSPDVRSWHCIEPDPQLAAQLAQAVANVPGCSVTRGTLATVAECRFDAILYIDVLEHIEGDRGELAAAANLLRDGGHLIVLSPAHKFLASEFDAALGHYRRYNRRSLLACSPPDCRLDAMFYLDCAGILALLANRILRQRKPTAAQIALWDRALVPISRVVDPVLGYTAGKTICGVWSRL